MKLTIKTGGKLTEEENESPENSDTKSRHPTRTVQAKLCESLKKNWKANYCMASTLEVWIDSLLVEKTHCCGCWGEI